MARRRMTVPRKDRKWVHVQGIQAGVTADTVQSVNLIDQNQLGNVGGCTVARIVGSVIVGPDEDNPATAQYAWGICAVPDDQSGNPILPEVLGPANQNEKYWLHLRELPACHQVAGYALTTLVGNHWTHNEKVDIRTMRKLSDLTLQLVVNANFLTAAPLAMDWYYSYALRILVLY